MASTERTVVRGLASVAARSTRATASVPARVLRPYWKGMHASWICCATAWASTRPTRRRSTSLMTRARTRPFCLRKATTRPTRSVSNTCGGTSACASSCAALWRACPSSSSSNMIRRCSFVMPGACVGPTPGTAQCSSECHMRQAVWLRWPKLEDLCVERSVRCRWAPHRVLQLNKCVGVSGARGAEVRACPAAESSPRCTKAVARAAGRHPHWAGAHVQDCRASCKSWVQYPCWRSSHRLSSLAGGACAERA